jgi:nucleoside 2-deoxyribosyltransferase
VTDTSQRVFISSPATDLPAGYRAAAVDACRRVGVEPLGMDNFVAGGSEALTQVYALLDQADIYIAILASRYGFVPAGEKKSFTELEYEYAVERGIPRLIFMSSGDRPARSADVESERRTAQVESFKNSVRRSNVVMEFRSADELKAQIVTGLVELLRSPTGKAEPASALLLLPFGDKHKYLRQFLSSELEREGARVFRLDAMKPGAVWVNALADAISGADFVIADVTDASPNVMYELGYVHALRKPTIMLAESDAIDSVPSDLLGYQFLTYDKDELGSLRRPLARFLHEYAKEARR